MKIFTDTQLNGMSHSELTKIVRKMQISGRSKLGTKEVMIKAILKEQTKVACRREAENQKRNVRHLEPETMKEFVKQISSFMVDNPEVSDEEAIKLVAGIKETFSLELIQAAAKRARHFVEVRSEAIEIFTANFHQEFETLVLRLQRRTNCQNSVALAALYSILEETAEKYFFFHLKRTPLERRESLLGPVKEVAKRLAHGWLEKPKFTALCRAVERFQEKEKSQKAARQAKAEAEANARQAAEAEAKARREEAEREKENKVNEIFCRPGGGVRFFDGRLFPVALIRDRTEAQMAAAAFARRYGPWRWLYVRWDNEYKRIRNSKGGQLEVEDMYDFETLSQEQMRRVRRGEEKTDTEKTAKVVSLRPPKTCPIFVSGDPGTVCAQEVVNVPRGADPLDFLNSCLRHLQEVDWAVVRKSGNNFRLFGKDAGSKFRDFGLANKADDAAKRAAKERAKRKEKAKA